MCKVRKNPLLCRDGVCYVGRGWADNPEEPSWYLNFTHKPTRGHNRFYYIDIDETSDPDCVADFSTKLEPDVFGSGIFSVVVLELLPIPCFGEGTFTIRNAKLIAKDEGLVVVISSRETAERAAQQMRESGLKDVRVVDRMVAHVYSEKGVKMAEEAKAMLSFRYEPENYKKASGEEVWKGAEELGADLHAYAFALGRK